MKRRAVTLLEMLLVLSLLAVLAALSWPSLERSLTNQRLRQGAAMIRTQWTQARIDALESGQTLVFRYTPGGNRFVVQVETGLEEMPDLLADASAQDASERDLTNPAPQDGLLPAGVVFLAGQVAEDSLTAAAGGAASDASISAEAPIRFYPDGTTSDAERTLTNDEGATVTLSLRGLTGVALVAPILAREEQTP